MHRFHAMAHELEARACTLPSLLKWQRILVRLGPLAWFQLPYGCTHRHLTSPMSWDLVCARRVGPALLWLKLSMGRSFLYLLGLCTKVGV